MSAARADRLVELAADRELDAVLLTNLTSIRYLTGFTGTNAACIVAGDLRLFITDFRYVEQAEREVDPSFERARGRQDLLEDAAGRLSGRVGFEDQHLTVRAHTRLGELLGGRTELVAAGGLVERLRAVKEPDELRAMRAAAALTDDVLRQLTESGLVGRTERGVTLELEALMRQRGAEGPAFPPIVAAAEHGALPHASPRDSAIPRDTLVVVDLGCVVDGYCSDCTRTFATGSLTDEAAHAYELVLEAQGRSLAAVEPGAGCSDVDAAARDAIDSAGHGEHFGHGLGHGVGLEVHEGPRLAPGAEGQLEPGNVVTVEPGVYVPGSFGVRIEDLVAVTEQGYENLTGYPKSLTILDSA